MKTFSKLYNSWSFLFVDVIGLFARVENEMSDIKIFSEERNKYLLYHIYIAAAI